MPAEKMKSRLTFPQNPSSQELMMRKNEYSEIDFCYNASSSASVKSPKNSSSKSPHHISRTQWITVIVLFFVNLINYMDRLTIAGILRKIQKDYQIGNSECGALQTAFVISYMVFAPMFGYVGDRHSRKIIMAFGVFIWAIFTLIGSFMPNYYSFLACRAMVGIGEASYSTIAPTIISDMFVKDVRSKMLAFFYFAIPVGSGLGYIVGSETTNLAGGDWRWGLRVTPVLGLIAVGLILCCLTDPPRGESEGHGNLKATTYAKDLKSLACNKSFVLSTMAFTCVTFCTGALSWWGPKYIETGILSLNLPEDQLPIKVRSVSFIFGAVTMVSGIVGVPLGSILSTKLKTKYSRADPMICAFGLISSAVLLGLGMITVKYDIYLTFALLFLGEVTLNLNWSIVADILLYVVVPTRRSTAEAVQILLSHALGDAGSPYLIGIISDALRNILASGTAICSTATPIAERHFDITNATSCDLNIDFYSMQYSLFTNCGVEIIGGFLFLVTAIFVVRDKLRCERIVAASNKNAGAENKAMILAPYTSSSESSLGLEDPGDVSLSDDEGVPQLKPFMPPTSKKPISRA